MIFQNRYEAGKQLAETLSKYIEEDTVVVALPRGGVPVAYAIARELHKPLTVLVARKLGAPFNPEYGFGAIAQGGVVVLDSQAVLQMNLADSTIRHIQQQEREELDRRVKKYKSSQTLKQIRNKTVILVDDGLATGMTVLAATKALLRQKPEKLIIAIPVCARDSARKLENSIRPEKDEVLCLAQPRFFYSVGQWYGNFPQVEDEEVITILNRARLENTRIPPFPYIET